MSTESSATGSEVASATVVEPVRRNARWKALAISSVVGVAAFGATACTPEMAAKDAIAKYWGNNAACAERVAYNESKHQPDAVSPSGQYVGLFQIGRDVHAGWIKAELGYDWSEMKDPYKNAHAAKVLSEKAHKQWGDGWRPWRFSGANTTGCPR